MMSLAADDAPTRRRRPPLLSVEPGNAETESLMKRKTKQRKRRRATTSQAEEPFIVLLAKVGLTLLVLCAVSWKSYRWIYPYQPPPDMSAHGDDDDFAGIPNANANSNNNIQKGKPGAHTPKKDDDDFRLATEQQESPETPPPLPLWDLGTASHFDAFGVAERYHLLNFAANTNTNTTAFWQAADSLRKKFAQAYGGENAARALLERGLTTGTTNTTAKNKTAATATAATIPPDLMQTACRIQQATDEQRPFRMAFGGYSVTAGRGNHFTQSFPLVLEKQLHTVFNLLLGIPFKVKNAAIGGCPALPYGWCMSNFWGLQADVVSWDYSMNEAGGVAEGLEAYLRHALQLPNRPALIVKDTHLALARRRMLQHYFDSADQPEHETETPADKAATATATATLDYVVIHTDPAVRPFLDRQEQYRPTGFQEWRKFGSPPGAPGQALHHPAVKEHELIAWLLTMHFLRALELVAAHQQGDIILQCPKQQEAFLPRPVAEEAINATRPWSSILFGERVSDTDESVGGERWKMNPVHCRTTFEPIVAGDLSLVIVSGGVGQGVDVMLPKSKMFYNRGWVLDLSDAEKQAKRKLNVFGGLGYVDSKKAYYGIFSSGTLRLLLPYEPPAQRRQAGTQETAAMPVVGDKATDWFKSIVVCEVNEKRDAGACQTDKDVTFTVGGANVTNAMIMDAAGTLYLGKKLCLYISVPADATLTSRKVLSKQKTAQLVLPPDQVDQARDAAVGLVLDVSIVNRHIVQRDQACSVSHVVWEQQSRIDTVHRDAAQG